jgi:hypothetical protein
VSSAASTASSWPPMSSARGCGHSQAGSRSAAGVIEGQARAAPRCIQEGRRGIWLALLGDIPPALQRHGGVFLLSAPPAHKSAATKWAARCLTVISISSALAPSKLPSGPLRRLGASLWPLWSMMGTAKVLRVVREVPGRSAQPLDFLVMELWGEEQHQSRSLAEMRHKGTIDWCSTMEDGRMRLKRLYCFTKPWMFCPPLPHPPLAPPLPALEHQAQNVRDAEAHAV